MCEESRQALQLYGNEESLLGQDVLKFSISFCTRVKDSWIVSPQDV